MDAYPKNSQQNIKRVNLQAFSFVMLLKSLSIQAFQDDAHPVYGNGTAGSSSPCEREVFSPARYVCFSESELQE